MRFFKIFRIALLLVLPFALVGGGCAGEEERKYKLTYDVLKAIECVPWPVEGDGCLCFGEIPLRGVFAFWAPNESCDDPLQPLDSDAYLLLDEEESGEESL